MTLDEKEILLCILERFVRTGSPSDGEVNGLCYSESMSSLLPDTDP